MKLQPGNITLYMTYLHLCGKCVSDEKANSKLFFSKRLCTKGMIVNGVLGITNESISNSTEEYANLPAWLGSYEAAKGLGRDLQRQKI